MVDTTETETVETTVTEETTTETASDDLAKEVAKWKTLSRQNEKAAKAREAELEKLRLESMSDTEKAVAQAKAEGRAEAFKDVNRKLLHAEVRAAAAGVLADPDDAVHLLDLDSFDTDGEPDRKAIKAAIEQLAKAKPYLSAQPGNGSGEGGPRGAGIRTSSTQDPLLDAVQRAVGGVSR